MHYPLSDTEPEGGDYARETIEDELPLGIFPEAHPEFCYHALRQQGLPCTRLNA